MSRTLPFSCRAVGLDFMGQAPWRFENEAELAAPPQAVFDLLADAASWPQWFPGMRSVEWTSPEPRAEGATRIVTLQSVAFAEHFLVWEPGRRFAFRFDGATRPLFKAGVEDYRLEDLGSGRTRFSYGVYVEPSLPIRLLGPVTRPIFARMFAQATQSLVTFVAAR